MCAVAPFLLPGLACAAPRAAPVLHGTTVAACPQRAPAAMRMRGYGYDDGGGSDQPVSTAEFLALSRPEPDKHADFGLQAVLRGLRSIRIPAAGFALPFHVGSAVASPTTPVASLPAPRSYSGSDDDAVTIVPRQKSSEKQQPEQREGYEYDAGVDATYRAMEKDPMERPSADYLETTQGGKMMLADRAGLVAWMHGFARSHGLAPGALHRAVSYVDRFLSAKKLTGGERELHILGATAVFAAAKYEDSGTALLALDADGVASDAECTRREVLDAERELVATVGYRLGGPTAYTFVEHFTRHMEKEGAAAVRSLAHRLADLALLDCRCLGLLPSAVAASAVVLAKLTLDPAAAPWSEELEVAGYYELEELAECMEAIREMYGLQGVWPGCTEMMKGWSAEAIP